MYHIHILRKFFYDLKYNDRYILGLLGICLLLLPYKGKAQSQILDQYVKEGLENNLALQQENQMLEQRLKELVVAKSYYKPEVFFNASYTLADGGRTIDVPIGDALNPVYTTLNELTDSDQFPQLENASEQLFPNKFHDTRIGVKQPLFNTDIYYGYKAKRSLVSVQEAQRDAYKQELTKDIRTSYFNYLKSVELLNIYNSTETLLEELVRVNQALVANHKATKDVVYSAQFELDDLRSKVAEAERSNHLAKSYFNFLLNKDLESEIEIDNVISFELLTIYELSSMQSTAVGNREELNQLDHAILANESLLKLNKGKKIPELSLGFFTGFQGFGYEFDNNQSYYLTQFQLALPIFTGGRNNANIQKAKIQLDKTRTRRQEVEQRIKVQVVDAYRNLEAAQATVKAKEAAFNSAHESFKIIKRKYEENQVILVEYLDARTKYTNSEIALAIARYELLIRQAELQRTLSL